MQAVEALLVRHPDLDREERSRLLRGFLALPALDKAVILADVALSEKLDSLYREHRHDTAEPYARIGCVFAVAVMLGMVFMSSQSP